MTCMVLIPWAMTDWQTQGRYAVRTIVGINSTGEEEITRWIGMIADCRPVVLYVAPKSPGIETAERIGRALGIPVRTREGLEEVSIGLWEGLTSDEIGRRFPRIFKQWKEDPSTACPPDGEETEEAAERLESELWDLANRHAESEFALVLGPLALMTLRCRLEEKGYNCFWSSQVRVPVRYQLIAKDHLALSIPMGPLARPDSVHERS